MDLIFVSMENWDDIWRRNQFICAELTRRFPDGKILFVGLTRDVSNQVRRGRLGGALQDDTHGVEGIPQITVTRPIKLFPNSIRIFRQINDAMARRHILKHAHRLGLNAPLLWLNPHSAVHMIGKMGECAAVYDITDDWTTLTQSASLKELTIAQDAEMCSRADAVIVCSDRLYEMKKSMAQKQNLHLIPNGVDAAHYSCVLDDSGPLPVEVAGWEHPVLGYTGTIHRDRVDVALVEAIAQKMTHGSIALVGPSHLSDAESAQLTSTGKVHLTGAIPYGRVPQLMRGFDICITPHLVTDFTESLNPIKLWEYLACGKPIISTPVAGFRNYPQYVRLANDAEGFIREMSMAQEGVETQNARRHEALDHSWQKRTDTVIGVMEQAKQRRQTGAGASS